jgi:hypothetical protein
MDRNQTEERAVMNSQVATIRVPPADAAIRAVEGRFRRLGWYLRTSGLLERTSVRIAAAVVFVGALASIVWLATSLIVAL